MSAERPLFDPSRMAVARQEPARTPTMQVMTVSHLSSLIKSILGDHLPGTIHLVGQVSNCCKHSSGHLYLTLKDERSEIRAVMWRSALSGLKFQPADGMEVIATGHVDLYENRGQYQFYISRLEPRGVGALELAFRQLQERLEKEGLFDRTHKKAIPRFPRRIAIVTSPTGAAVRDILKTLQRRCRCVSVLVHPVRVQGEGAAQEIAAAIRRLNEQREALGGIDTVIVARGGGSLEDLWAFNEEEVARAIFESRIPVISGVGHEVDTTIADFVADLRAATPTAAAELAVPVLEELLGLLSTHEGRLARSVRNHLNLADARLNRAAQSEWFRDPLSRLHRHEQRLDEVQSRLRLAGSQGLHRARRGMHALEVRLAGAHPRIWASQRERIVRMDHRLQWVLSQHLRQLERRLSACGQRLATHDPSRTLTAETQRLIEWRRRISTALAARLRESCQALDALRSRLDSTSHQRTLTRGYTITRSRKGQIITRAADVREGDRVSTETADGSFDSRVSDQRQGELFE